MAPPPLRLASNLLRLALDPRTGRLSHNGPLPVGVRCAHLLELVIDDRLVDDAGHPKAVGAASSGDRVADGLWNQIRQHEPLPWMQWYWKRQVDLAKSFREEIASLVSNGTWRERTGHALGVLPVHAYIDISYDQSQPSRQDVAEAVKAAGYSGTYLLALGAVAAVSKVPELGDDVATFENDIREHEPVDRAAAALAAVDGATATITVARSGGAQPYGPMSR